MNTYWKRQREHCIKKNMKKTQRHATNMRGSGGACENVFKVETPVLLLMQMNCKLY